MGQASFRFNGHKVISSSFAIGKEKIGENFTFEFDLDGNLNNNEFTLTMIVKIEDDKKMLSVNVSLIGDFEVVQNVVQNVDQKTLNNYLYTNAPAILFPYIRAYISTLTSLSGIVTIIMPTLNMEGEGQKLQKKMEKK